MILKVRDERQNPLVEHLPGQPHLDGEVRGQGNAGRGLLDDLHDLTLKSVKVDLRAFRLRNVVDHDIFRHLNLRASANGSDHRYCCAPPVYAQAAEEEEDKAGARTRDTSGIVKEVREAIFYLKK
eukprot:CAMPEP_0198211354 /NCGR_PEP_ID=MMETSP1445-20131203/23367_1 /TAXON_ID=36898 /ORGANISM="Pyramimonas sp., Strain CCMP2087" /LENGTH=124 /DNA_ID=CAMNT_0043885597 /DNA_START=503 /DNA_END=878 /DNA_ORIENTATION=-